jgi:flagellar protein FlbT
VPLRLTLKPNERVIVAGAVLRNGDSRTELLVENEVAILREGDILGHRVVRTACDRVTMALQVAYLDAGKKDEHLATFRHLSSEVRTAAPSLGPLLDDIEELATAGRFYQALKKARVLRAREKELIENVRQSA